MLVFSFGFFCCCCFSFSMSCNWFTSTQMYTCFGGFFFHIGAYIVWYKIPCVTQWVLESYFRDGYVRMLVWSSSFLPARHLTFVVTGSFPSKSLRLCLFLKDVHLHPFLDYTQKWYHVILLSPCLLYFSWNDHVYFLFCVWTLHYILLCMVEVCCVHVPHLLYPFMCACIISLLPCLGC